MNKELHFKWDMQGKSTTGHSDLNMATIHKGVRTI